MVLENCPTTKTLNEFWNQKITDSFPILERETGSKYLSLKEYIANRPQKFYSENTYEDYLTFLHNLKKDNSNLFISTYKEYEHELNIAIKTLNDINSLKFHDQLEPDNNIESILFIENNIHFNYVKLIEAVYHKFLLFIAYQQRVSRNKPTSGLDIYNCVEEIKKTDFRYVTYCYENTIRNGIAHGGLTYKESDTIYKGKKGSPYEIRTKRIIRMFDDILDICNGFSLAFKIFTITQREYFQNNDLRIPRNFLLQELKAQANAPKWEVIDCLENEIMDGKKQLNIFTKNSCLEHSEVNYYAFRTAVFAEYFASGFDRYFFSLKSKYSLPGWAGYKGEILKRERIRNSNTLEGYEGVLEENLLYFIPRLKLPKLITKIIRFIAIAKTLLPIEYHRSTNYQFKRRYFLRDTKPFRRGLSIIINDPSLIITPEQRDNIIELIRRDYKKIIRYAIRKSKKEMPRFWHRFLRTNYIRVTIYDKDLRKRQLRGSGLIDSLVCSITLNRSSKIKNIDFIGGQLEQKGKYRIIWNGKWKGIKHVC
ncbi:hypothetical protein OAC17_01270 [Flavobacteriaceae bacterium]|nr:hypothetical protein [Flavobacteriaceae bacterium]MDB9821353.1 hypothetical protein [Flavobacteriaceae bacterium]